MQHVSRKLSVLYQDRPAMAKKVRRQFQKWMSGVEAREVSKEICGLIDQSSLLQAVVTAKIQLNRIWERDAFSCANSRLQALQKWYMDVEGSGIQSMIHFSTTLRRLYTPQA